MLRLACLALLLVGCGAVGPDAADAAPPAAPAAALPPLGLAEMDAVVPDFTLQAVDGSAFSLSAQRGKTVVLEWFNPDCPFVEYAYDDGPLQGLSQRWSAQGVVWVAVNSGAPGKQGSGADRNRKARADWSMPGPVLLDEDGRVGRLFDARTTPQIVVIDDQGRMVYNGGLDNAPLGDRPAGADLRIYADEVLAGVTSGAGAPYGRQKPYGCSVKY